MAACPNCNANLEPGARFCSRCGAAAPAAVAATEAAPPPTDPLIGRSVIGQYTIRRRLGEGGMGAVYLADQPSVGRRAVIKVIHPQFSRDPAVAPRFEIEARAAARLTNPHIVAIYNYGDMGDGTLFLAMEHLEGQNLEQAIRAAGAFSPERAVRIAVQACDALAEAHRAGVVHRDLKPPNIMLVKRGRDPDFVKVLDFGIAKLEGEKLTATGAIFGTPQYMSPEQLRGESPDGRSDLYSLGVILFEMLTAKLPFQSTTPAGFMHKHLSEPPPRMHAIDPRLEIPPALEAVVQRALAKDPAERPATAEALAGELEAALVAPLAAGVAAVPAVAPRRASLNVRAAYTVGGLFALAVAIGAFLVREVRSGPPPAPPATAAVDAAVAAVHIEAAPVAPADAAIPPATPTRPAGNKVARARPPAPVHAALPPAPGPPPARPPPGLGASPPMAASPEAEALLARSLPELESELRRLLAHARVPPSMVRQLLDGYAVSARSMNDDQRKGYLTQLILSYRKPELRLGPGEEKPLRDLIAIYMAMKTKNPMTEEVRKQVLDTVLKNYDESSIAAEDRDFYKRTSVVGLIKSYAEDPGILSKN